MTLLLALAAQDDPVIAPQPDPIPYEMPSSAPWNAPSYVPMPTPDGTGSAVHPGVHDFVTPWNGYRFWMAVTPYFNEDVKVENPCILASHDGHTWVVPDRVTNPLYPAPPSFWNSDTDLAYDPVSNELVMIYKGPGVAWHPHLARSATGHAWPTSPTVSAWGSPAPPEQVSPALVRQQDGTWVAWTVQTNNRDFNRWTAPAPEGPWSGPTTCTITPPIAQQWHHDIIDVHGILHGLMVTFSGSSLGGDIYAITSTDGVNWASSDDPVLSTSDTGWDARALYRPTLTLHEDGDRCRVWYGGIGYAAGVSWRIGYTEIPLTEWPDVSA